MDVVNTYEVSSNQGTIKLMKIIFENNIIQGHSYYYRAIQGLLNVRTSEFDLL